MTMHEINGREFEVTSVGAVFYQGIQVLIPAEGVDMLEEMAALYDHLIRQDVADKDALEAAYLAASDSADPDAVATLDTSRIPPVCGEMHPSGVAACELIAGHEGRHHGWMPPGDISEGPEDISWPVQHHLYWNGFNAVNVGDEVHVSHESLPNEVFGFPSRNSAASLVASPQPADNALNVLPAMAALAWFNEFQPEWESWEPGETVVRDDGLNGFVVHNEDGTFLVASTGRFIPIDAEHVDELKRWRSE